MYNSLKNNLTQFVPKKILFRIEPFLRKCFALFKKGNKHSCIICDFKASNWVYLPNNDLLCPNCGSLARDRRLWQLLKNNYIKSNISVLDFSPSRSLFRRWKKVQNVKHVASDLSGDFISDVSYDITQIPTKEAQFDLIICFHVLEHVLDDIKAMNELYRVLKPDGTILIQTPFREGKIYENNKITSEAERLIHFGQEDHVRVYSILGLKNRLEQVGFNVEVKKFEQDLYLGLVENETILILNK